MKKIKILLTIIPLTMILGSCSISPKEYSTKSPKYDIREYFKGNLEAYGILKNRSGKVTRTFTVKMKGSWNGNKGKLEEYFIFDDGETDQRIWEITMIDDNNFTAKAHDVVGIAKGEQRGNAMRMDYVLRIPVDGKKYDIKIQDWMYLVDKNSLINESVLTKFGFKVGSLTIGFKKIGI